MSKPFRNLVGSISPERKRKIDSKTNELLQEEENPGWVQEDPSYPIVDWKYEVQNGDTWLGYRDWTEHKKERVRDSNTCSKCGADLTVKNSVRREYISKSEDGNSVFGQGHYDTNGDYDPDISISFGNRSFDLCDDSDTCAACGGQL